MSPLILVGLLTFTLLNPSLGDVKHVLEGSAHPPDCKCAQGGHHHYQNTESHYSGGFGTAGNYNGGFGTSGNHNGGFNGVPNHAGAANNAVPGSVAFWWADSNSPFKHAYEHFKKCSLKGNCFPPVAPGFEGANNVPQSGCGPSGCTVSGSIDLKGQSGGGAQFGTAQFGSSQFGPVDIKKNPFLNGNIQGVAGSGVTTGVHGGGVTTGVHGGGVTTGVHGGGVTTGIHGGGVTTGVHGGGVTTGVHGGGVTTSVGGGHIDISGNPFLGQHGQTAYSGNGQAAYSGNGQAAYSGNGQAVVTGSDGFLGVQPAVPFGKGGNKPQPFPTAYPSGSTSSGNNKPQPFPGAEPFPHPSQQPGAQPFPTNHPSKDGKFENCKQAGHVCVAPELCLNGLVKTHGQGLFQLRHSVDYCEIGKEVCCRIPEGEGSSYQPGGSSSSSYSSYSSSGSLTTSSSGFGSAGGFGSTVSHSGFANLSDITAGKSSVPGASIKFSGGAGLSPGVIKVLSPNENVPNPLISTAGESGSGHIHTGSSIITNKVARDTTPNPNSVFSSTTDYSNDKFDQLSFVSTTRGPQYLPPVSTPVPSVSTPDLEVPHISTYQPSIPTTPRPLVTRPVIPGSSVVSVYTPKPFVPSSPKPFVPVEIPHEPQPQQPIPSYTYKPTTGNGYLPPRQPSSPTPFVTQPSQPPVSYTPFPTRPSVSYTQPPFTRAPTFPTRYIPPQTSNTYVPPKVVTQPPTFKPYSPSTYRPTPQPSQPVSHVTGGYSYPTPTPAFEYPKPTPQRPLIPSPSVTVNNQYVPPRQPTPSPTTTSNQYIPPSQPTPGYQYPTPSPPFEYPRQPSPTTVVPNYNFNNQYITPKKPSPTYSQSTPGYSYPTPTPPFVYPTPSTPKPYNPQPQPSGGYTYRTPTPAFTYPTPSPTFPPRVTEPPYKPTNNGYLPPTRPEPNRIPEGSNFNPGYVKYPTQRPTTQAPTYIPPIEGQPDNPNPSVVFPPGEPSVPYAGCAAALRCVQEIYCTADGFISQTPVTLSREQEYLRVPTTDCQDKESGVVGKCCRDPNYVDPWPSANLINGFDNGQYREDPTLGQYFPQKQRPARSETSSNSQNLLPGNSVKTEFSQQYNVQTAGPVIPQPFNTQVVAASNDNTCGLRNPNAQPRGDTPLHVAFGEIPWQAMVLRDSNRSLLCGGVIVRDNAVLTAAHCVEGLSTSDILIKGGEWKLGIDEEPQPFQICKVAAIVRHPGYQPGLLQNDLALLMLQEKLRFANNVAPICLPPPNQPPSGQCIATGWGKDELRVHLRGAIMKSVEVTMLDSNQCSDTLANRYQHVLQNFSPNTICGYSQNDQCNVDYGSALACTNGNGQYTLAGIYSWDTGCKDESQIGGYVPPDVEWIETTCSKPLTHLKALDRQFRAQYRNQ